MSPNYPGLYPSFSKCTYTIATESFTTVVIAFGIVRFAGCDNRNTNLRVISQMGNPELNFCGYKIIQPLILQGTTTIIFSIDCSDQSTGFRATYNLIPKPGRELMLIHF